MKTIKIEVLYPELNHLYGDKGNLAYLKAKLDKMQVPYEVVETNLGQVPAFTEEEIDILYVGPTTESYQRMEAEALLPYRDAIAARMEGDKITLMTGNAFELLGAYVEEEKGDRFACLDLIPTYAKRFTRLRYNDLSLGTWQGLEIVGFKNQLSHSYVLPEKEAPTPFLSMQKGNGWNKEGKEEGFCKHFFFATYLIGPILPLNPKFTEKLLRHICEDITDVPEFPYEMDAYHRRKTEFAK